MPKRKPRWFKHSDLSSRFRLDRETGRIASPDLAEGAGGEGDLRLYASGDIIWERALMGRLLKRPPEHPFAAMREVWGDGDIVFGQLETCFGEERTESLRDKRISYLTDPGLLPHFAAGGFDLASQASNHTMDNGLAPIEFTRRALTKSGIASCGSGANLAAARKPASIIRRGKRVALLAYNTFDPETSAEPDRPGNAPFLRSLVMEDIRACREEADFVIISVHKGREFIEFPSPEHQADCRALIDAGADLILGHHPHIMQGIEWRKGPGDRQGLILYCLGSLLVDYEPPLSGYEQRLFTKSQRNNYVAGVSLGDGGVTGLRLTPIRQTEDDAVRVETDREAAETFDLVEWCSHPLNHEEGCRKFWLTGWPYLVVQHTSSWMHFRRRPASISSYLRWFLREETVRLHWGTFFAADMPRSALWLRRSILDLLRVPLRWLKRWLGGRAHA